MGDRTSTTATTGRGATGDGPPVKGRPGRPKIPLPPEAIEEYLAGGDVDEIAARYGMSAATVMSRLRDAGVTGRRRGPKRGPRRLSDEQVIEARRRYLEGATASALGSELGISGEAMRLALTGRTYRNVPGPVEIREKAIPSMPAAERDARIVRLGREGLPLGMITAKTNVTRDRALAVLAAAGIEPVIPPRRTRGSQRVDNKLVEADVALARELYRAGETCAGLARRFGLTFAGMAAALRGRTWSHVPGVITEEEWRGRQFRSDDE